MVEKLAELIWEKLQPKIKEAYTEGYKDGERRILKAFEYGWNVGHADTLAMLGDIDIEEISKEEFDQIPSE